MSPRFRSTDNLQLKVILHVSCATLYLCFFFLGSSFSSCNLRESVYQRCADCGCGSASIISISGCLTKLRLQIQIICRCRHLHAVLLCSTSCDDWHTFSPIITTNAYSVLVYSDCCFHHFYQCSQCMTFGCLTNWFKIWIVLRSKYRVAQNKPDYWIFQLSLRKSV